MSGLERDRSVRQLSVALVKGTAVEHPGRLWLSTNGAENDRRFVVIDPDGKLVTSRMFPRMLLLRARLDPGTDELVIEVPEDSRHQNVRGSIDLGDAEPTKIWDRPVLAKPVRGFDDWLSTYLGAEVRLLRIPDTEGAHDDAPVTLISSASISELSRLGGVEGGLDAARFRMTFEIEGCDPFEEESWVGRRLTIGRAQLDVDDGVPRCVVTEVNPGSGEKDLGVLKLLARHRGTRNGGLMFGMNARVVRRGSVSLGDRVKLA